MMKTAIAKLTRLAALVLVLAPLGACALADVASGPAPSLYVLTAPTPALPGTAMAANTQLSVREFQAPSAIDTGRIVFQPSPNEIKYYAGARWSDRAPRMIASLLVETLTNTGRFPAILGPETQARTDLALTGDIRAFSAFRDGAGLGEGATKVRVAFFVRLVRARGGVVLAGREFTAEAASASGRMDDIVAAYNAALDTALSDITAWTLEQSLAAMADEARLAS
ncbi:ABC-type transport auxiliary lipoprotein family protein [Parvibaculum lavamentivorans]|nr:ABC-type transport auxiliary lipoprotein family protein [Parvibaculum lavamentivorans]